MTRGFLAALAAFAIALTGSAQTKTSDKGIEIDGVVRLDKTVHDFGEVLISDGALSCTFTVTNISSKAAAIFNVVSSCGCTDVKWTRDPIAPGKEGKISATYSNDEGPYPFDKTLTVYFSDVKKPVILRLRGSAHNKKLTLSETYTVRFGQFAMKDNEIKLGNMSQNSQRSDEIRVANIGKTPITVTFSDVSEGLNISVSPNPIPPDSEAKLKYTVTADRKRWGMNHYFATPLINGKPADSKHQGQFTPSGKIGVWAFTKEDFSGMTKEQRATAPQPVFKESTYSFGILKAGEKRDATFSLKNNGKSTFRVYKADSDTKGVTFDRIPEIPAGKEASFKVHLDTSLLPSGTFDIVITLTTNAPDRPIINLFLAGAVK